MTAERASIGPLPWPLLDTNSANFTRQSKIDDPLVADTLTLPLAIYMRQNEHASDDAGVPLDGGNQVKSVDKATQRISLGESRPDGRVGAEGQDAKSAASELVPSDRVEVETEQ